MKLLHRLLLLFRLPQLYNGLVSTLLVKNILYSADLMFVTHLPLLYLIIHRYIYSRYSSVFLMLYQLYHSLLSSTCHDLAKWLSHYFFSFLYGLIIQERSIGKCHITRCHRSYHVMESHDECGKVAHRPCSSCISSVQEFNKDPIEFSLLTWIRSRIKCSPLSLTLLSLHPWVFTWVLQPELLLKIITIVYVCDSGLEIDFSYDLRDEEIS